MGKVKRRPHAGWMEVAIELSLVSCRLVHVWYVVHVGVQRLGGWPT